MQEHLPQIMGGGGWIFHLLYYSIPKTGSTSIRNNLGNFNLIQKNEKLIRDNANKRIYKYFIDTSFVKPNEVFRILGKSLSNYHSFCSVRNPWDRIVSLFLYYNKYKANYLFFKKNTEPDFEEFCNILLDMKDNPEFIIAHNQMDWINVIYPPKVVLRFENLEEDFANMIRDYNISHINPKIPHHNKTNHENYKNYYNSETKKIIANIFEKDIDILKYSF